MYHDTLQKTKRSVILTIILPFLYRTDPEHTSQPSTFSHVQDAAPVLAFVFVVAVAAVPFAEGYAAADAPFAVDGYMVADALFAERCAMAGYVVARVDYYAGKGPNYVARKVHYAVECCETAPCYRLDWSYPY
jgi:hypothetical protein